jgi:hypothetical protein
MTGAENIIDGVVIVLYFTIVAYLIWMVLDLIRLKERRRCARIARDFAMKPDRNVLPGRHGNDVATHTAYDVAQTIANIIMGKDS